MDAIVLDCQGLKVEGEAGSEESGGADSSDIEEKLFLLSVMLSSQLVFNTRGAITD